MTGQVTLARWFPGALIICLCVGAFEANAISWSNHIQVAGVGSEGQGAGVAFVNLDGNVRPEMILMAYDNPELMNSFRYKIGWNVNANGQAASWSNHIQVAGVGWEAQGAGVAFTYLDGNSRPEMILMAYDNPELMNSFRYKIGWNVNANGQAASWSNFIEVAGVGWEGQGADVAFAQLDGNGLPEMIVMAYDNPQRGNNFRYKIGWDFTPGEDDDHEYVGYVSNEESRFKGYVRSFLRGYRYSFYQDDKRFKQWDNSQYYWGQCRVLGKDHLSFVDSADLAYIAGHGSASYIVMSSNEGCSLSNKGWGSCSSLDHRGDLEYIVFQSCQVLSMDKNWRQRWMHDSSTQNQNRPFSGLHIAMGFRTTHSNGAGAGGMAAAEFAENLKDGYSVRLAWYEAAVDARAYAGKPRKNNKPAVFYIRPHKNETVLQHNSPDYCYGSLQYKLDTYYLE